MYCVYHSERSFSYHVSLEKSDSQRLHDQNKDLSNMAMEHVQCCSLVDCVHQVQVYGGFHKLWYPQIINFGRIIHSKSSVWGTPNLGKPQCGYPFAMFEELASAGLHLLLAPQKIPPCWDFSINLKGIAGFGKQ